MKTINDQHLTKINIPDGEGFIALPIAFINVIARNVNDEAIPSPIRRLLRQARAFLAMTWSKGNL
jgi:hypothetical protein